MAQQPFGGIGTISKLGVLERYLDVFTTALSKQGFQLVYFDAFAYRLDSHAGSAAFGKPG